MPDSAIQGGYARLHEIGLISDAELHAAIHHPTPILLKPPVALSDLLAWLIEQGVVAYSRVVMYIAPSNDAVDELQEAGTIMTAARAVLEPKIAPWNARRFDELEAAGLICAAQRALVCTDTYPFMFESPGQALAGIVDGHIVTRQQFNDLHARVVAEAQSDQRQWRVDTVEAAAATLQALDAMAPSGQPGSSSTSSSMKVFVEIVFWSFVALNVWYFVTDGAKETVEQAALPAETSAEIAAEIPMCDAARTIHAVKALARPRPRTSLEMLREHTDPQTAAAPLKVALGDVREIGFASVRRERGCSATVTIGDLAAPIGFVVGPLPGSPGSIGVIGGQSEMINLRYSRIGANGDFLHQAEPIGRANLKAALRAGVDAIHGARHEDGLASPPVLARLHGVNLERQHEVADVEPLEACREVQKGTHYACRLMLEHDDPMFPTLLALPRIVDTEFTFVRDPDGKTWRMSDDFADAWRDLVGRARAGMFKRRSNSLK